ncbi:hypothetical protein [Streptomyces apocyni]|uniref:hypothetical protein n=1 Tax=Streptomyces apocyni TaxID=2654677 RepID=UPI001E4E8CFB|nr:hypothetical protein [Streptomyces apocyni]
MKLRRAVAVAAATAVIAPAALLAAPMAYADDTKPATSESTEETTGGTGSEGSNETETETEEGAGSEESTEGEGSEEETTEDEDSTEGEGSKDGSTEEETAEGEGSEEETTEDEDSTEGEESDDENSEDAEGEDKGEDEDSDSDKDKDSDKDEDSDSDEDEDEDWDEDLLEECTDTKVDLDIKGLPGKIAAGSGWHKFNLTVANNSDATLTDLVYVAGASADKDGVDIFKNNQVQVQAYNNDSNAWETLGAEYGYAVDVVGFTDQLKPNHYVDIAMRLNVKASAPVGAGFSLGGSAYSDSDARCEGWGETAYKFQIVASGTDTDGTKPQTGGTVPVPDKKPDTNNAPKATGELAETGSSSMLPTIGLIGGITIVAGAGVMFAVKRRRGEDSGAVA